MRFRGFWFWGSDGVERGAEAHRAAATQPGVGPSHAGLPMDV
jgi:hypothetical protein